MMMKILILLAAITCSFTIASAQSGTVSSGGQATGSGGNVSYSIGQMNYVPETGSNGTVNQGLQQPYEILIISGIDKTNITMNASVYPNPSDGNVTLNVDVESLKNANYSLFDVDGKYIIGKKIQSKETSIPLNNLAEGVYYIKVLQNNTELKSFKIIKNK